MILFILSIIALIVFNHFVVFPIIDEHTDQGWVGITYAIVSGLIVGTIAGQLFL